MTGIIGGLIRAALVAFCAVSLFSASPAWSRSPESQALGEELANEMFGMIDFKSEVAKSLAAEGGLAEFDVFRKGWGDLMGLAITEEFDADLPKVNKMFGRAFGQAFTTEELRVGLMTFRDPAVRENFKAGAEKRAPRTGLKPSRAAVKAMESPAGRSFYAKMDDFDKLMAGMESELIVEILPGALRRFADKAEAAEAARAR